MVVLMDSLKVSELVVVMVEKMALLLDEQTVARLVYKLVATMAEWLGISSDIRKAVSMAVVKVVLMVAK